MTDVSHLTQLGRDAPIPQRPEDARLERVPNPQPGTIYLVRFTAPEFTSLCPMTAQPDFAHLVIDYVPGEWLVESKSLKLYLTSFRNHGAFHEDCTVRIGKDLVGLLQPAWLRIGGYWYPRGGIPIDVFWQTGAPPHDLWLPDQGVPTYRGRGRGAYWPRFAAVAKRTASSAARTSARDLFSHSACSEAGSES